jgi:hypothetical protein
LLLVTLCIPSIRCAAQKTFCLLLYGSAADTRQL